MASVGRTVSRCVRSAFICVKAFPEAGSLMLRYKIQVRLRRTTTPRLPRRAVAREAPKSISCSSSHDGMGKTPKQPFSARGPPRASGNQLSFGLARLRCCLRFGRGTKLRHRCRRARQNRSTVGPIKRWVMPTQTPWQIAPQARRARRKAPTESELLTQPELGKQNDADDQSSDRGEATHAPLPDDRSHVRRLGAKFGCLG